MHLDIGPKDTTLEAARMQFSILRKIDMEGRGRMVIKLSDGLRSIIPSSLS